MLIDLLVSNNANAKQTPLHNRFKLLNTTTPNSKPDPHEYNHKFTANAMLGCIDFSK
jgi:hypothetical protein